MDVLAYILASVLPLLIVGLSLSKNKNEDKNAAIIRRATIITLFVILLAIAWYFGD